LVDRGRTPWRLRGLPSATLFGIEVPLAARLRARLLGLSLLRSERAGAGLLIEGRSSVHSFGMRFALDLVFLGDGGTVLRVERAVPPYRVRSCAGARAVLELPSAARGLEDGEADQHAG
jgi:uncharacterized membrane protein (UPF0127 family)